MITEEFFLEQEAKIKEYQAKGYQEILAALNLLDKEPESLIEAGLLHTDGFYHTAQRYNFEVTEKGNEFLRTLKGMGIIFVRPNKFDALKQYLKTC